MRYSGFVSLRTVVALCIIMTVMPIAVTSVELLSKIEERYDLVNDELCLYRLRRMLLIAYDTYTDERTMNFIYKDRDGQLSLINGRLLITPGYQMFLDDIDSMYFMENEDVLYWFMKKIKKNIKLCFVKRKGFVSQIFVIILMLTMSYTAIMSESIRTSLNAFVMLKENIESFENEARYIHKLK